MNNSLWNDGESGEVTQIEFGLIDDWTPEADILSQALLLSLGNKDLVGILKPALAYALELRLISDPGG